MPKNETAVANPPAGGPQEFASTNDDNINEVLQRPYVVTIAAHGQVGVISRHASQGDADRAAAAAREGRPAFVEISVVKENDPEAGLPAKLAEVEGAEFAAAQPAPQSAAKPAK